MGALLGVSRGSQQPARFIILEHGAGVKAAGAARSTRVRRQRVTSDSGGISLKPGSGMEDMKFDMCGAAAVFGAMQAVAALKVPQHIVGLIAATENLPSASALKPGDVLKTLTGQTIEIINTDAEGRLILADATWVRGTLQSRRCDRSGHSDRGLRRRPRPPRQRPDVQQPKAGRPGIEGGRGDRRARLAVGRCGTTIALAFVAPSPT